MLIPMILFLPFNIEKKQSQNIDGFYILISRLKIFCNFELRCNMYYILHFQVQ